MDSKKITKDQKWLQYVFDARIEEHKKAYDAIGKAYTELKKILQLPYSHYRKRKHQTP